MSGVVKRLHPASKSRLLFLALVPVAFGAGGLAEERGLKNADHWSYQPLRQVAPPASGEAHPIDAFVFSQLARNGLKPNPPAERRLLIRRLTFDLHGLPPTPQETDAFVADPDADGAATAKLIERLLASSRYGERWARHWLDVARYSESQGFERDKFRPNAWRYRDYVIGSLNGDKPYDLFAREQIAGDVLEPVSREGIIATGFLVAGPWDEVGNSQASPVMKARVREEELEDLVGTVGQTFLGVTINCARCHDHKFDPIPAKDYYAFKAVFEGIWHGERTILPPVELTRVNPEVEKLKTRLAKVTENLKDASPAAASPERDRLQRELGALLPEAYAATPRVPQATHLLERGDIKQKRGIIAAGGLCVLNAEFGLSPDAPEADRRKAFAHWMTSPENPLFARTIVNRVWHYHFGTGLVATPNDLGVSGGVPSHPGLLDWLAGEFIRGGWSLKQLHTLILTSKTWRQASTANAAALAVDAGNRLLWRFSPQRLEAEEVRDALLAISGSLNPAMGGPSDRPYDLMIDNTHFYTFKDGDDPEFNRRTIYRAQVASLRDSLLDSLDCPGIGLKSPVRGITSTPVQALSMMNNAFVDRQCRRFAGRLEAAHPGNFRAQLEEAFQLALGRRPTEEERHRLETELAAQPLDQVCWVLFNTTEFAFVQ
ncbi:MAG: DUF1549 and DUF1553 domain-containing protein [Verrucomicrobiales bacterium]